MQKREVIPLPLLQIAIKVGNKRYIKVFSLANLNRLTFCNTGVFGINLITKLCRPSTLVPDADFPIINMQSHIAIKYVSRQITNRICS